MSEFDQWFERHERRLGQTSPIGFNKDAVRLAWQDGYDAAMATDVQRWEAAEREAQNALAAAREEIKRLHSWAGLMSVLDEHYPADLFDGSSDDLGARIVALTRAVDEWREAARREGGEVTTFGQEVDLSGAAFEGFAGEGGDG